jgi:hypothetical protein
MDFRAPSWMSASVASFLVAATTTLVGGGLARLGARHRRAKDPATSAER